MESIAGERDRRRGGAKERISNGELQDMVNEGLTVMEMTRRINDKGIDMTHQGVSYRLKQLGETSRPESVLPWTVRRVHADGNSMYKTVLAYGKWRRGMAQSDNGLRLAREFESLMSDVKVFPPTGAVMVYDSQRGFMYRSRRPADEPSVLAKE